MSRRTAEARRCARITVLSVVCSRTAPLAPLCARQTSSYSRENRAGSRARMTSCASSTNARGTAERAGRLRQHEVGREQVVRRGVTDHVHAPRAARRPAPARASPAASTRNPSPRAAGRSAREVSDEKIGLRRRGRQPPRQPRRVQRPRHSGPAVVTNGVTFAIGKPQPRRGRRSRIAPVPSRAQKPVDRLHAESRHAQHPLPRRAVHVDRKRLLGAPTPRRASGRPTRSRLPSAPSRDLVVAKNHRTASASRPDTAGARAAAGRAAGGSSRGGVRNWAERGKIHPPQPERRVQVGAQPQDRVRSSLVVGTHDHLRALPGRREALGAAARVGVRWSRIASPRRSAPASVPSSAGCCLRPSRARAWP